VVKRGAALPNIIYGLHKSYFYIKKGAMTCDHCPYLIGYNLINRRVSSKIILQHSYDIMGLLNIDKNILGG